MIRERYREGGGFEEAAAYSRAVRHGSHVLVSGTAAREPDAAPFAGNAYEQAREAIRRALAGAEKLGARPEDVARTRMLLAPDCDWEGAVRAHREAFEGIEPANTTYFVGGFIPSGVLVEIELDALLDSPPR